MKKVDRENSRYVSDIVPDSCNAMYYNLLETVSPTSHRSVTINEERERS
jgi:hypothetical protein